MKVRGSPQGLDLRILAGISEWGRDNLVPLASKIERGIYQTTWSGYQKYQINLCLRPSLKQVWSFLLTSKKKKSAFKNLQSWSSEISFLISHWGQHQVNWLRLSIRDSEICERDCWELNLMLKAPVLKIFSQGSLVLPFLFLISPEFTAL